MRYAWVTLSAPEASHLTVLERHGDHRRHAVVSDLVTAL